MTMTTIMHLEPETKAQPTAQDNGVATRRQDNVRDNAAAQQLLREWLADESGYDEETWPVLKPMLAENHSSNRELFND